ncbi:hypothetical protein Tco_0478199 [Tanacetum coccineum]
MCNGPSESKILMNIIKNHPLRFSIAASASVPWIYMAQFWHTLKEDGSKHRLKFLLDRKELTLTLDDFRTIFHLPQANDNNHASFVPPPSFSDMVPFYKQVLGFTMELKTVSNFKIIGLLQPGRRYANERMLTEQFKMYAEVFGLDVPLTQSQPTESTQGTHRTPSAPRQSARLTPPVPVPSAEKADEMILQDMIQVSLAEHKSREEQEARENVALEKEEETTKDTEVEPDKDTPMVDVTNIVPPVNVDDEEDEIIDEVFELRRRVKGKNVEETRISPIPSPTRSPRNLSTLGRYGYLFAHLKKRFMPRTSSDQVAGNLHDVMMETLPSLVKEKVTEEVKNEVPAQVRDQVPVYLAEGLILGLKGPVEAYSCMLVILQV